MNDPLRKPRKLRFRVSRALLVSAPLVGSLACGEPAMVNTGPVEEPRVNVPAMHEPPVMEERPVEATNVVESPPMEPVMEPGMEPSVEPVAEMDPPPPPPPRPRMVNPGPRERGPVVEIED